MQKAEKSCAHYHKQEEEQTARLEATKKLAVSAADDLRAKREALATVRASHDALMDQHLREQKVSALSPEDADAEMFEADEARLDEQAAKELEAKQAELARRAEARTQARAAREAKRRRGPDGNAISEAQRSQKLLDEEAARLRKVEEDRVAAAEAARLARQSERDADVNSDDDNSQVG